MNWIKKKVLEKMIKIGKERLSEPSTWAGLAIVALIAMNVIPANVGLQLIAADLTNLAAGENWVTVAMNILGVTAGAGGIGALMLKEKGRKALMAFAVLPLFLLGPMSEVAVAEGTAAPSESALYTFTVSWNAPTARVNGEELAPDEIGGYLLTVELPSGKVERLVDLPSDQLTVQFPVYEQGSYAFTIQAFDVNALYSEPSDEVVKLVDSPIKKIDAVRVEVTCASGSNCTFYWQ